MFRKLMLKKLRWLETVESSNTDREDVSRTLLYFKRAVDPRQQDFRLRSKNFDFFPHSRPSDLANPQNLRSYVVSGGGAANPVFYFKSANSLLMMLLREGRSPSKTPTGPESRQSSSFSPDRSA